MKKISAGLLLFVFSFSACHKKDTPPVLRFEQTGLTLNNYTGVTDSIKILSGVDWTLAVTGDARDLIQLDKTSGSGNATVNISILQPASEGASAQLTLSSPDPNTTPVQLTIQLKTFHFTALWSKRLGGSSHEEASGLSLLAQDKLLVSAHTQSNSGDITNAFGSEDGWVLSLDQSTGNLLSQRTAGGSDYDAVLASAPTGDGGYISIGYAHSSGGYVHGQHGNSDVWIGRFNSNRDTVWTRTWGGSEYDYGTVITPTTDGNFIVAGFTTSDDDDFTGRKGEADGWVMKINGSGQKLWSQFLRAGGADFDELRGIAPTADGGCIVVGRTASSDIPQTPNNGDYDAWVVKVGSNGQIIWQETYGTVNAEEAQAVTTYPDGSMVFAGTNYNEGNGNNDGWIVKLDKDGALIWNKAFGGINGSTWLQAIAATADGGCVVGGETNSSDLPGFKGGTDALLIKVSGSGRKVWDKLYGGQRYDAIFGLVVLQDGSVAIAGSTDSSDGDFSASAKGGSDVWVTKIKVE